jgi:hypothetical protein
MKPKFLVYFTVFATSLLSSSCSLFDLFNPEPKQLLSKVYFNNHLSLEYTYDDDFKLIGRDRYNSSGILDGTTEYEYNSKDQLVRINYLDKLGAIISYELNEFDSKGLLVKKVFYYKYSNETVHRKMSSQLFEYNSSKKCIKYTLLDQNDQIQYYSNMEYSGSNCTKENLYSPSGNLLGYLEYQYDTKEKPYLPLPDPSLSVNNITHLTSPLVSNAGRIEFVENNKLVTSRWAYDVELTYTEYGFPETVSIDYLAQNVLDEYFEYEYITR